MAVMLILPLYILDCELMWSLQCFHCSCVCVCMYLSVLCIHFVEGRCTLYMYVPSIELLNLIYTYKMLQM